MTSSHAWRPLATSIASTAGTALRQGPPPTHAARVAATAFAAGLLSPWARAILMSSIARAPMPPSEGPLSLEMQAQASAAAENVSLSGVTPAACISSKADRARWCWCAWEQGGVTYVGNRRQSTTMSGHVLCRMTTVVGVSLLSKVY